MLKASISLLKGSMPLLSNAQLLGSLKINIAIAYYDNGWISRGWDSLFVGCKNGHVNLGDSTVLLNQSLRERRYCYFYATYDNRLANRYTPSERVEFRVKPKNGKLVNDSFWLEDENFYRKDAKYYGPKGIDRMFNNLFGGNKWIPDWYEIDVGGNSDYTIDFEIYTLKFHTVHPHRIHNPYS